MTKIDPEFLAVGRLRVQTVHHTTHYTATEERHLPYRITQEGCRLPEIPNCCHITQEAQLSLGQPTILVVSNLQGHPKSTIFISFESQYATSYQR